MTGFRDIDVLLATPRAMAGAAIFLLASAAWLLLCIRLRWSRWFLVPFVAMSGAAALFWATNARMDWDEVEHLHAAWLVAQGDVPYRDFWQHHPPLLWIVLAPLVDAVPANDAVVLASRIVGTIVLACVGWLAWLIARALWGDGSRPLPFLVVFLASAVTWQFAWVRPDSLALPFLLVGALMSVRAPPEARLRWLLAGGAIGLGLAFTYKNAALVLLPVIAAWTAAPTGRAARSTLVVLGLLAGALPLVAFLWVNDAARGFTDWVVFFNARIVRPGWGVDAGVMAIAAACTMRLFRTADPGRRRATVLFRLALVLAVAGVIASLQHVSRYHLSFLLALTSAAAAGWSFDVLAMPARRRMLETVAAAGVSTLLVLPAAREAWNTRGAFARDRQRMLAVLAASSGGSVLTPGSEHPIVRRDAARLHTVSQVRYAALPGGAAAWTDGTGRTFDRMVRDARPAVVSAEVDGLPIASALERARILDRSGADRLRAFLREEYVLREIDGTPFHIPRERLGGRGD